MKTTVELPDELYRTVKVTAARDGRSVKDLMVELLQRGLADRDRATEVPPHRVELPLLVGDPRRAQGSGLTPQEVAEALIADEADVASR